MIDTRQLREGNYLYSEDEQAYVEIDWIDIGMIDKAVRSDKHIKFQYIPLDDVWFDRFDFLKLLTTDVGGFYSKDNHFKVMIAGDGYYVSVSGKTAVIGFVHQLQNLYYFVGDELKVTDEILKQLSAQATVNN